MSKRQKPPLVAIIGRPNVGKSTLFNRIIGKQRAIVHDIEGITRDRYEARAVHKGKHFRLVDTGGIMENPVDPISRKMQDQVQAAIEAARVIVFVVDAQADPTRMDEEVRDALFRTGKPVVLAANKLDNPKLEMNRFEFYGLGIGDPIAISSGHGLGIEALLDALAEYLPAPPPAGYMEEEEDTVTRIAVIGKPNVGKSSFVNAILNEERTIVHENPGTTRDAIDVEFRWKERDYLLIDTAGLRKKAGIKAPVEHFSVSRSLRAIRRAHVCLVLLDATEGITEQDKRILGYTMEQGRPMVLVLTKWDLIEDRDAHFKKIAEEIDFKMPHIKFVPYVTLSNITRQRLFSTFEYVDRVAEEGRKRIPTGELNAFIDEVRAKHPAPSHKGKRAKIRYATQVSVRPTTFVLFVNQKSLFHFSYLRFIENQLRERYTFEGVPIKIELRQGKPKP
ncbi:MAG: ribosome biogenesis GTPase Der [Candidatus Hydrogenedentota bacterium]